MYLYALKKYFPFITHALLHRWERYGYPSRLDHARKSRNREKTILRSRVQRFSLVE